MQSPEIQRGCTWRDSPRLLFVRPTINGCPRGTVRGVLGMLCAGATTKSEYSHDLNVWWPSATGFVTADGGVLNWSDAGAPGMPEVPSAVVAGSIAFSVWSALRPLDPFNSICPMKRILSRLWIATFLLPLSGSQAGDVIINEIMYHPVLGDRGRNTLNSTTPAPTLWTWRWRFEKGISFVFPTNTHSRRRLSW